MALAVFSKSIHWIKQKYNENRLVHASLVLAVMGWLPLVQTPLMISLVGYAAIKRNELTVYLNQFTSFPTDFFFGSTEEKKQAKAKGELNKSFFWSHIGNAFNVSPLNTGKVLFSSYILAIVSMPWSFLMIYALYQPRAEIIQAVYAQGKVVASSLLSFYKSLSNVKKTIFVLLGGALISGMLKTLVAQGGWLGLFDLVTAVAMLGLAIAGVRLLGEDFFRALSDPVKLVTNKIGILLGMIGGNRLAHTIFSGKISGVLGPAYGVVESSGFFPSLYRMIFSNNPYGKSNLYFANSVIGNIFGRMSTGIGGVVGSLFFSHDVITYGSFYGTLGPTSYQLLGFMAMGAVVGYFIDKAVDRVSKIAKADAIKTWENNPNSPTHSKSVTHLKTGLNFSNRYRVPITMTLMATGLFYGLKMPLYMSLLHTTASPLLSILGIEAGLLLFALPVTKVYRVVSAQYQKYFGKKENLNNLDLPAASKSSNQIEVKSKSESEIDTTKPEFTIIRSNLKPREDTIPNKFPLIEEEENENEIGLANSDERVDMDDELEKRLSQSWSFQDKEPEDHRILMQSPQPVSFRPHLASVAPKSPKQPKLPAGINVDNILPESNKSRHKKTA